MSWQRRLRLIVGIFVIAFAATVYLALREREAPTASTEAVRTDPDALVETTAGELILGHGEAIRFERQLTYADGRTVLMGVAVTVPERDGRGFRLTGREAEKVTAPASQIGQITITGSVRLDSTDDLIIRTSRVTYDERDELVRAPERVEFERGRLAGSGIGATYDRRRDVLWLLDQAVVTLAPDETQSGSARLVAGTAGLARADHYVRAERGAVVERGDQQIEADTLVAYLTPDDSQVTAVELRGKARVRSVAKVGHTAGPFEAMQADEIDLTYTEDGRALERARLSGGARITLAGKSGTAGSRIAARTLDLEFGPDGATLVHLVGRDAVTVDLPATNDVPTRHIRALALEASGPADRGLHQATFTGDVDFRESIRPRGGESTQTRVARAQILEAELDPGLSSIDRAYFRGNVGVEDQARTAAAATARYEVARGVLALGASRTDPGPRPQVADGRVTIDATSIVLWLDSRRIEAAGNVQSVLEPPRSQPASPPAEAGQPHLPAMLNEDQPVFVTAAHLVHDGDASLATYTGDARLWQGDTQIQADSVTLDDRRGNLTGNGQVRSTFVLERTNRATGETERIGTIARARTLTYDDAERRAVYEQNAHVNGPQGDVEAGRIELFLNSNGRELRRAEAYDAVAARLEGGFRATGDRLTYFGDRDGYLMRGRPVRILEVKPEGCRETVGTVLTFLRSTDTINVEGTEGNRSKTTPVPCAERQR